MKLLLVEDARVMAQSLCRQLSTLGYTDVTVALSAEEALDHLRERDFDAVLLDWLLPKMSGLELLQMIRSSRRLAKLPVVMTTANGDRGDVMDAFDAGATDYLIKPYVLAALEEKMTALAQRVAERAGAEAART